MLPALLLSGRAWRPGRPPLRLSEPASPAVNESSTISALQLMRPSKQAYVKLLPGAAGCVAVPSRPLPRWWAGARPRSRRMSAVGSVPPARRRRFAAARGGGVAAGSEAGREATATGDDGVAGFGWVDRLL